jgi:ribosomal protein S18 acetylase RimI-like enzyme
MTVEAMRAKGANDVRNVVLFSMRCLYVISCLIVQVVLETELSNTASLALYEKLGFCRSKLLRRYYINGNDAYRLKLYLTV